jgi:mediator of RNA polymerase II transcription subunit 5
LYEEFGACFLLVMACVKRFNLSELDVASLSPNNLVAEIISTCATPMKTEDMTSAQQGYLTNWTKALFVDEEIRDKLMSDCPPRDFYKLLPSLLKAAIVAYGSGHLSKGNLNGGLECKSLVFITNRYSSNSQ